MLGARTPPSAERAQRAKNSKKSVTIVHAHSIAGEGARAPSIYQSPKVAS